MGKKRRQLERRVKRRELRGNKKKVYTIEY
jgi:hypothetical protein